MLLAEIGVLLLFSYCIQAFNLEYRTNSFSSGNNGSYYGYALATQSGANKRLLVGAPKAFSAKSENLMTGNTYQCNVENRSLKCTSFRIFETNNLNDQWFGATISTSDNNLAICAPKYNVHGQGRCLIMKNPDKVLQDLKGQNDYDIMGISAAFSPDSSELYIGGPGRSYNSGGVWRINFQRSPPAMQTHQASDRSYFGYTVAIGLIARGALGYAVAAPFHSSTNYRGKVAIYSSQTASEVDSLLGTQPGEYFGASMAVTDVNGDHKDDIIIGAPHFTDYNDPQIKYDAGKVYIFQQSSAGMKDKFEIQGNDFGGRFGSSVCAIGDVNRDQYNDIAVGAPYEDSGKGAVYIFHGSASGIRNKAAQIIRANQLAKPFRSFGYSLSGGVDFDNNGYPDLFVGAYQSDSVIYIPARSIITLVDNFILFQPKFLSLEEKNCTKQGEKVSCVELNHCLMFRESSVTTISLNVSLSLDVKKQDPRLLFLNSSDPVKSQVIRLKHNTVHCELHRVYVKPNIRDKLNAMEVQIELKMEKDETMSPVLNVYRDQRISSSLPITKQCGHDDVCIPNLFMDVTADLKTYIQGTKDRVTLNVNISNHGEDAYESEFSFQIPPSLSYINVNPSSNDYPVHCSPPTEENKWFLRCDVGNPIRQHEEVKFVIFLQPTPDVFSHHQSVGLFMEVNSTNREREDTQFDNRNNLTLTFDAETSLLVNGWFQPESITLNLTLLEEKEAAKTPQLFTQEVAHFYEISTPGPSDVLGSEIVITVPFKSIQGLDLFNFTSLPEIVEGPVDCSSDIKLPTSNNDNNNQESKDASIETETASPNSTKNKGQLDEIPANRLATIRCNIGRIGQSNRAIIKLKGQFYISALTGFEDTSVTIKTSIDVNITALPFGKDPSGVVIKKRNSPIKVEKVRKISLASAPLWLHFTSAIVALAILGLLALLAYKMGFFKRNKPPTKAN